MNDFQRETPMEAKTSRNDQAMNESTGFVRKAYQKPVLKTYGPVKQLTRGGGSVTIADGNSNMGARPDMMG
jgi:hypothetical protein